MQSLKLYVACEKIGYTKEKDQGGHPNLNKRPRGLDALLELKTQYTRMF